VILSVRASVIRSLLSVLCCLLSVTACKAPDPALVQLPNAPTATAARKEEPPVALNADIPIEYPQALYQQGIEGRVLLKLWVDSTGKLADDSTKVAESSGYPAFDSAAVASADYLKFAPGRRNGVAVGMSFTQPIVFRHPQRAGVTP
jgi:TonB family protein